MATFEGVSIVVRDMAAMVRFYRRMGVELGESGDEWDDHHRHGGPVDLDSATFTSRVWDPGWPSDEAGVVLAFRCGSRDEVDALHAELVAGGATSMHAPHDAFWGARYAIATDPDGNHVGFMSPSDDAFRSRPPSPPDFSSGS